MSIDDVKMAFARRDNGPKVRIGTRTLKDDDGYIVKIPMYAYTTRTMGATWHLRRGKSY